MFLLSTDEEIGKDEYGRLSQYIAAEFSLIHNDENQCTSIVPGYIFSKDMKNVA